MQDPLQLAALVLAAVIATSMVFRLLLLTEFRRFSAEQKARLFAVFYRQNKVTLFVMIAAILLIAGPPVLGVRSPSLTIGAGLLACAVAVVNGVRGNLVLRRLRFPSRYVALHACHASLLAIGLTVYWVVLTRSV